MRGGGGPLALPGKYIVRLKAGSLIETKPLELRLDPRGVADGVTQADLEEQLDLLLALQQTMTDARTTAAQISRASDELSKQAGREAAVKRLRALHARLVTATGAYPQPMLIDQLASIARMAGSADQKVGRTAFEYFDELKGELAAIKGEARALGAD